MALWDALLAGGRLIVVGLIATCAELLWPLPTVTSFGGPVGWRGPGDTSDNALRATMLRAAEARLYRVRWGVSGLPGRGL